MMSEYVKKVKTVLDHSKLKLKAPNPLGGPNPATLGLGIYGNNPRLIVSYSEQKPDGSWNSNFITAASNYLSIETLFIYIDRLIEDKTPNKYKIENMGKSKGGDPKVPEHLTDIIVGRDEKGIYIGVDDKINGLHKIKFYFGPIDKKYEFHKKGNNEPVPPVELSEICAKGWANLFSKIIAGMAHTTYVEPEPYKKPSYQKPNYGSYNKVADEDIPF